jgi:hypothetical protein
MSLNFTKCKPSVNPGINYPTYQSINIISRQAKSGMHVSISVSQLSKDLVFIQLDIISLNFPLVLDSLQLKLMVFNFFLRAWYGPLDQGLYLPLNPILELEVRGGRSCYWEFKHCHWKKSLHRWVAYREASSTGKLGSGGCWSLEFSASFTMWLNVSSPNPFPLYLNRKELVWMKKCSSFGANILQTFYLWSVMSIWLFRIRGTPSVLSWPPGFLYVLNYSFIFSLSKIPIGRASQKERSLLV